MDGADLVKLARGEAQGMRTTPSSAIGSVP
jgi:hypothetical protein